MPYADPHDPRKLESINKYNNSYRGFIITKLCQIFKPSKSQARPGRNNIWAPECTKKDIWQKFKAATKKFNSAKNTFYKFEKSGQQENLKKKIALITGVTGQDGSHLADFLLTLG